MVFVPSGVAHGRHNVGAQVLRLRDVFPSVVVSLVALERNPAPGTAGGPPQPLQSRYRRDLAEQALPHEHA
jgi:hypothetical protein